MRIEDKEWAAFSIEDIATISSGKDIVARDRMPGSIPYVSASEFNNGIIDYVGNSNDTLEDNCLSVNRNGSVGYCFYHPYKALFSNECRKLKLKNRSPSVGIFISKQISKQRFKFGYGYKLGTKRIRKLKITLPVNENREPDYEWMENYVKEKEQEKKDKMNRYFSTRIKELKDVKEIEAIKNKEWAAFPVEEIFPIIQRGKQFKKAEQEFGNIPFVSASEKNNGVSSYISDNKNLQKFENCLGINNDGSVGWCFYHPYEFAASSVVTALKNEEFSKYTYLFLAAQISKLRNKFSYGYKLKMKRLKKQKIMLPVNENGRPDYEWMAGYMRRQESELLAKYKHVRL